MIGTRNGSLCPQDWTYFLRSFSYNPNIGEFTTLDPYAGDPTNPLSYNKYLYTQGDPVNGSDPTGRYDEAAMAMLSMATGGDAPRAPVVAPSRYPDTKLGLIRRLQTIETNMRSQWPDLFRIMGFEKFFDRLLADVAVKLYGVAVDPTLKAGNAYFRPSGTAIGNILYVSSLGINGTEGPTLIHEAVHVMDWRNSWYLSAWTTFHQRQAEGLGYGVEKIIEMYERLIELRDVRRMYGDTQFKFAWIQFWKDAAATIYNNTRVRTHFMSGWKEDDLTGADVADTLAKLGLQLNETLIAPLFAPVPK